MSIPVFASAEHDPHARGRALGAAFAGPLARQWAGYEELFLASGATPATIRQVGGEALERTQAWAPALAAEIGGVADGSGLAAWQLGALNGRTEVLAAVGAASRAECSTFVALGGTGTAPRTIQTWDWHDHLADGLLAARIEPRPGHRVRLFTELGIVGKIGVSSAGLGLHFNILGHAADGGETGVPVHVVARRILDEATTLDEAEAIARSAAVSASTILTVVTFDGTRGAVRGLELSPAGLAVLGPDDDGVLVHTNHFLDPELARGERHAPTDPGSLGRLDELRLRADALRAADDLTARATAMLDHRDASPLCCHPDPGAPRGERWQTLVTASLDLAAGELVLQEGGPCAAAERSAAPIAV
ncbi:C45 family peptidase [Patulibacter sp. SYSU D01012]|uniref:C45 family autoproteolytic acyltransferase/hydolase n=1 Tax=Patulibacter sp. SYSU D01012 TaxID=2817381 RepID=UPI001B306AC0|nr:C45 family peptidase [Patulibacter sp. SYSU D01012]